MRKIELMSFTYSFRLLDYSAITSNFSFSSFAFILKPLASMFYIMGFFLM